MGKKLANSEEKKSWKQSILEKAREKVLMKTFPSLRCFRKYSFKIWYVNIEYFNFSSISIFHNNTHI